MTIKYIANRDGSIRLPYQHDGEELLSWLQERYPNSKYRIVEAS